MATKPKEMPAVQRYDWTPAIFRDRAEELRRRLKVWHVDDLLRPISPALSFLELQNVTHLKFRDVILRNPHRERPEPPLRLYDGLVTEEEAAQGIGGHGFYAVVDDTHKDTTRWLFRDYHEALVSVGNPEYLRLKYDRLLDLQMYRERRPINDDEQRGIDSGNKSRPDDGPFGLIGGCPVDPTLLDEFVAATIPDSPREPQCRRLGDCQYEVGGEKILVTDNEDRVFEALIACGPLTKTKLETESAVTRAHEVLSNARRKYNLLAPFITTAGKKGGGGYRVNMVDAEV